MIKFLILIMVLIMHNNSLAEKQISNLITPVGYFINHIKQLEEVKSSLSKYKRVGVIGTSGIGKTQLVRTYAYENKNLYNLIWAFDCNLDINAEFVKLAKQLNQVNKANISEDTMLAKKEVIEYLTNKNNWLLIFDNLKIGDNKKIKDMIDWEYNGNIIFCSQESDLLSNIVEINIFSKEDAITLANIILKNKDHNSAGFLAESFKGYPIFIVQGAQLLNQVKGLNKEDYKNKVYRSADKVRLNIELAIKELSPNAAKLLRKIALVNNQGFSKELLSIITDNKASISEDLYQLSKFMLISNIDHEDDNPVFEMHDIIAAKITEINGDKDNIKYLEDIIIKLVNTVPKSVLKGRIFRNSKTISENFEIIIRNAEKYKININKIMGLNSNLARQYNNSLDYYNAEKKIEWFNKNDHAGNFKIILMNNDEKSMYASYLSMIGHYYRHRYIDYNKAVEYFIRSIEVFDNVNGYESFKFNIIAQLAVINATLGRIQTAEQNIYKLEEMLNTNLIDKFDANFIYTVKAKLLFIQGKYYESLELVDKFIKITIENGLKLNDLFLTNSYLLRAEILNSLGKYQEAYFQIERLYKMHKPVKREDHEIFGRIYIQMARSELGLGNVDKALEHITKAIAIFIVNEKNSPKESEYSVNPDLATGYVSQGDIFLAQGKLKQAIESYKKAQLIYFYLYKDKSKNIAHVSYLYMQGAKAACRAKDLYNYKSFGQLQVKEFGHDHINTTSIFDYCKKYNIDLWSKDN